MGRVTQLDEQKKITAVLQGRMGSTRLPGKVMLPLQGNPMIQCVFDRLRRCDCIDDIIIATSLLPEDDILADHFTSQGVKVFRGSLEDPLDRYYSAAKHHQIKHVMRAMADCPFIDPDLIDQLAGVYFSGEYDFCHLVGEFPSGLDTTIFNYDCLEKAWNEANKKSEREHITSYITNNPKLFKIGRYEPLRGLYHHRWVVDHPKDYQFAKAVYEGFEKCSNEFGWEEIVQFLEHQPEIFDLNSNIKRDEGYLKSLAQD
jgi:spore coat polysaccharide biosynthesis protein SpsF